MKGWWVSGFFAGVSVTSLVIAIALLAGVIR